MEFIVIFISIRFIYYENQNYKVILIHHFWREIKLLKLQVNKDSLGTVANVGHRTGQTPWQGKDKSVLLFFNDISKR